MSVNPIEENSTPKPTGSLEDLFRHHLGEEAAVPPRPMLWDQIDNSLLIRQNESYRRRLAATRWVAAASLVLASLAGTGWWAHRASDMAGAGVATVRPAADSSPNASAAGNGAGSANGGGAASSAEQAAATVAANAPVPAGNQATASTSGGTLAGESASQSTGFSQAATRASLAQREAASSYSAASSVGAETSSEPLLAATTESAASPRNTSAATSGAGIAARSAESATGNSALSEVPGQAASSYATAATSSSVLAATSPEAAVALASSTVAAEPLGFLASRTAALSMATPGAVPNGLAALALPEAEPLPATDAHKWHYGAAYTVGAFNPNVNFSRNGLAAKYGYNPALGAESPALTEAAATQYREHLRSGLSQRLALLASRRLTGRWSLRTGAEFSQATAQSASSLSFIGEQIPDLGQSTTAPLHTTDFRYRMASIPVEVRYADPVKRGWSLYGRLGGVMSVLLGVRSEVDGEPEATKTYSLASTSGPYRRLLGSVRGSAGAQYRPGTGNWALMLGPVAELGLVPLNARPAQSFLAQSRPYSFGVEAGVEFGR